MPKLPILPAKKLVKVFQKAGYFFVRQTGSHIRMCHKNRNSITIPNHKTVGPGLLNKILRDADMSGDDFLKLIKK